MISKIRKKISSRRLPKPKINLDRFGQLLFTFREVTKIAAKINLKLLILVFLLNGLWGLFAVPGFFVEKLIIDRLIENIGNPDWQTVVRGISFLVGLRLLIELIRNLLGSMNGYLRRTLSRLFDAELTVLMSKKLAELDMATIEDPDFKNKFVKIRQESGRRAWQLMMPLSDIPNYIVGFISAVGVLIFLHPLVAVGVLIISLPQIFLDSKFIKKGYELHSELSPKFKTWGWLTHFLIRNRNFMELKILNLSDYLVVKLRKTQKQVLDKQIALNRKREFSRFAGYIPLALFEFGLSLWIVFMVVVERITVGSFELYLRSLRSAQMNLTSLVSSFLEIYENYFYVNDLVWFLNLKPRIEQDSGKLLSPSKKMSLEFENVSFRYKEDMPKILRNISFSVSNGEKIAIIGENGAGKSTLIKLIARFYDPVEGVVRVAGEDIKNLNIKEWRKNLAMLFQEFETYPFSVQETVGYGEVDRLKDLEAIKDVVSKTQMAEFVEGLPLKYKNPLNPVFEKGVRPSIGQEQRFGISRMLFRKNAKVLIMDEPTSNVDPEAEEKIFKELLKVSKGKILIFVTQRFSTVRLADRIFVVDKGKIIEKGTHSELMKKDGKYARLFKLQARGYQ